MACIIKALVFIIAIIGCVKAELDSVPYLFGANPGAPPANWNDAKQAIIASKVGVNSYRVWLPENYLETWGYDIAFKTGAMSTYKEVGFKNLVGNLNTPTAAHSNAPNQDSAYAYSPKNLDQPIWLGNGNVNPDNYWAAYVNKTVTMYKDYIKIWEVWNEPDFVSNWQATQTWNTQDPNPSDLVNWHDTIQKYNRMMRITWEVARKVDPTAHVAVGGLGYPYFLDAMLRNTDGQDGSTAGNYFETLSFHFYPVFAGKNSSDEWADNFAAQVKDMLAVCKARSYTPAYIICTESGAPSKSTSSAPGSDALQRHYFMKMSVLAQVNGVSQVHWWSLTDANSGADNAFSYMGLYADITQSTPDTAVPKPSTSAMIAYTRYLYGYQYYDGSVDILTNLDQRVRAYAFTNGTNIAVVLWANNTGAHDEANPVVDLSMPTNNNWNKIAYDGSQLALSPVSGKIDLQATPTPAFMFSEQSVNFPLGHQNPPGSGSNNGPSPGNNVQSTANNIVVGSLSILFALLALALWACGADRPLYYSL